MKKVRIHTGPCTIKQIAETMKAYFDIVNVGTEHITVLCPDDVMAAEQTDRFWLKHRALTRESLPPSNEWYATFVPRDPYEVD